MNAMQSIRTLCTVVLTVISLAANAKDTVIWAVTDWPPYFITEGDLKGKGAGDRFTDYFISRLPEFEHKKNHMSFSRVDKEAKLGRTTCMTNRFYTEERAKHSVFTKPYAISLSLKIVLLKDTFLRLREPEQLSIQSINENYMLNGVLELGRSYGATLDPLLEQYLVDPNLTKRRANTGQLLDMLQLKRMDYFIEYPLNFNYMIQTKNLDPDKFVNVEISESPPYVLIWMSCSKTDLGRAVVERLNKVIDAEIATPDYWQRIAYWLSDKDAKMLERHYRENLLPATLPAQ